METSTKIDILAIIVSFAALYLAITQGAETRESNRVAVRPHLDVSYIGAKGISDPLGFKVDNGGLGPAVIDEMIVYVDGVEANKAKDKMWFSALEMAGWPKEKVNEFNSVYLPKGSILRSERELYLLKLLPASGPGKRELSFEEWEMLRRIEIKLKYSSFQDEKCSIHYTPINEQPYKRKQCRRTYQ